MIPLLAEISDKMPTVPTLWMFDLFVAGIVLAFAVGLSLIRRWAHLILIPLAAWWAWSWLAEYVGNDDWRSVVSGEMGMRYIVHSVAAGFLPLVAILTFTLYVFRRRA